MTFLTARKKVRPENRSTPRARRGARRQQRLGAIGRNRLIGAPLAAWTEKPHAVEVPQLKETACR